MLPPHAPSFPQWAHDGVDCGLCGGDGGTIFLGRGGKDGGGGGRGGGGGGDDDGGDGCDIIWHSTLAVLLKLRRSTKIVLHGEPICWQTRVVHDHTVSTTTSKCSSRSLSTAAWAQVYSRSAMVTNCAYRMEHKRTNLSLPLQPVPWTPCMVGIPFQDA